VGMFAVNWVKEAVLHIDNDGDLRVGLH